MSFSPLNFPYLDFLAKFKRHRSTLPQRYYGYKFGCSLIIHRLRFSGAVKSNIGHLEGASGIAGVIKTIMVLEKGLIPPNTNFEKLNPKIDAEFLNIAVCLVICEPFALLNVLVVSYSGHPLAF
jgi:Beta-ketoacyl synthase, C-terminal domain